MGKDAEGSSLSSKRQPAAGTGAATPEWRGKGRSGIRIDDPRGKAREGSTRREGKERATLGCAAQPMMVVMVVPHKDRGGQLLGAWGEILAAVVRQRVRPGYWLEIELFKCDYNSRSNATTGYYDLLVTSGGYDCQFESKQKIQAIPSDIVFSLSTDAHHQMVSGARALLSVPTLGEKSLKMIYNLREGQAMYLRRLGNTAGDLNDAAMSEFFEPSH
ncbi:hypothetical protein B0H14DRAFT_2607300 [Mycena olivaceomarginata]|nr:hypothetical protein B0H14DRAFT_2607300 [Mycena olivaceomarginata]